jgi:predicted ATPase with chaperone activity
LLDRIDLHIEVPAVDFRELTAKKHAGESSAAIRARITEARNIQALRFATSKGVTINAAMRPKPVREHGALDAESQGYLEPAIDPMHLSARDGDILEAIEYRALARKMFSKECACKSTSSARMAIHPKEMIHRWI